MIEPGSPTDLEIERLVRASLDRASERVDPRPLFDRIAAEALGQPIRLTRRRSRHALRWAWVPAAAIFLLAAVITLLSWQDRPALAKGETVVREAREAHLQPIDRCYLVEVRRESSLAAEIAPNLPQVRQTRLWTRGDRFWVESVRPDQRWAWGRDESNRFWIAFGPHAAVRYEADEVPDRINIYCDLHSLNVERWLGDVLDRFDLTREEDSTDGDDSSTIRIKAKARDVVPIGPAVQSAELEVDAETRVIRRMVVRRVWNGEPLASVTYSLSETDALDQADYQVEGHLVEPFEIFTRDHVPERRKELASRWFGNRAGRSPRPLESSKRPLN
jgi:hypothetical protein